MFPLHCSSCLRPPRSCPSIRLFLCLCRLCMRLYIQMYPALPISHIEESKRPVTIHSWCKKGWGHCQPRPFIVIPYRCLGKNSTPHCHRITEKSGLYIVIHFLCVLVPFSWFLKAVTFEEHFVNKENFCIIFIGSTLTFVLPMGVSTRACALICISIFKCWYWERTNTLDCAYDTTAS